MTVLIGALRYNGTPYRVQGVARRYLFSGVFHDGDNFSVFVNELQNSFKDYSDGKFRLIQDADRGHLQLHWDVPTGSPELPFSVDFTTTRFQRRARSAHGELLYKATGLHKKKSKTAQSNNIWDFTGGIGRDAYILAAAGCKVTIFERNPVLFALLYDGILRLRRMEDIRDRTSRISDRMCVFHMDSTGIAAMPHQSHDFLNICGPPAVVYLDPMYSTDATARRKSKVKKETQILQRLQALHGMSVIDEEKNNSALFKTAMQIASDRVVVKREINATQICSDPLPDIVYSGSTQRFDVYLRRGKS